MKHVGEPTRSPRTESAVPASALRSMAARSPAYALVIVDHQVWYMNPPLAEHLGVDGPGLAGSPLAQVVHPSDCERVALELDRIVAGEAQAFDARFIHADGRPRFLRFTNVVASVLEERSKAILGIGHDLLTQKIEEPLARAERLASIGSLAAGTAHQINNPLTYVDYNLRELRGRLASLARDVEGLRALVTLEIGGQRCDAMIDRVGLGQERVGELQELVEVALEGAERVKSIVHDLKVFSRQHTETLGQVDVNATLDSAIGMAHGTIEYRANIRKEYSEVPPIVGNQTKLAQALLNLVLNAYKALDIRPQPERLITLRTWAEDGQVCIEVRDNGCGIPAEHLDRIFDPFYTSHAGGENAGLGLSIAHNIVEGHGGKMTLQSEVDVGSSFVMRFPEAEQRSRHSEQASTAPAQKSRGRVLLVDDEPYIRKALTRALRDHEVVAAASGNEAKAILERDASFGALLCDMMMKDGSGMDLYHWMEQERPELTRRTIFMTGAVFTEQARTFLESVDEPALSKPPDLALLKQRIQALIEED